MKKVLLVNQGFSANIGDKAILMSLKTYLERANYEVDIIGFTHYTNIDIEENDWQAYTQERIIDFPISFKWYMKGKNRLENEMRKINKYYDYLVIGGGQLIKTKCYFPYAMSTWVDNADRFAAKKMLIGVGADPSFSKQEVALYKESLNKFDKILVRDKFSQAYIQNNFGVKSDVIPDVAFLLKKYIYHNSYIRNCSVVMPYDYRTYKYHFHNGGKHEEYVKEWTKLIEKSIQNFGHVKLMYSTIEDKKECYYVFDSLCKAIKENVSIVPSNNVSDFVYELSLANEVYSARMHALLIGLISGCKVYPIKVSNKISTFELEYINSGIDVNNYAEKVKQKLDGIFEEI